MGHWGGMRPVEWAMCSPHQSLILPAARTGLQEPHRSCQQGRAQQHRTERLVTGFEEAVVHESKYCSKPLLFGKDVVSKSLEGEAVLWELGPWNSCYMYFYMILDAFGIRTRLGCELLRCHVSALRHHWGCHGIQAFGKNLVHFEAITGWCYKTIKPEQSFSSSGLAAQSFLEGEFECTLSWLSGKRLSRRALCHVRDPCRNPKPRQDYFQM